jgi:hypothetical protein
MKFKILHTVAAVTFTAAATVGVLQAAEEQTATESATPTTGYVAPFAPYGFHPFVPPYAYAPAYGYGYGLPYAYGPAYGYGPWGANEDWFLAQDEAIQKAMDQQMQTELEWMDRDRLARRLPVENYRRWREADSDAWQRWVDPYGAWRDDMNDLRRAQRDAWVNARMRRHAELYRPYHRRLPLTQEQVAQEQTAVEPTTTEPAATEPAATEPTTEAK